MSNIIPSENLEKEVGRYGIYWIYHVKSTNKDLFTSLSDNAIIKIATEMNTRVYALINKLITSIKIDGDKYLAAEKIALKQIIYTG